MADPIGIVLAAVLKGKREIAKDTIRSPPSQTGHPCRGKPVPSLKNGRWRCSGDAGYHMLIVFLTKVLVSLTQLFCENPAMKNLKGLKRYPANFTLPIIYPLLGYPLKRISNFSQELHPILGDFAR